MTTVKINKVRKSVGKKQLLISASMELEKGEICALIGPNGAGKTSLLKIIMGLIKPDYGDVSIFNNAYLSYTRKEILKKIGLVLQFPQEILKMSVRDIYQEHFLYLGVFPEITVEEMIQDLGLEVNPDERPINFSLGMRQRLLLGLALSHHPEIIILDEPFNGLDVDGIVLMKKILVDYAAETHTVLITSHSLKELQDIVHTVIFMKEGKTQEKVDMATIKKNYDGDLLQFYQESKKQGDTNE